MKLAATLVVFVIALPASALEPEPDAVFIRVIDTGQGHSAIAAMPARAPRRGLT